jgi:hypothetical protein
MPLTNEEKVFIARRAAGEYAIIPAVTRIVNKNKKNRNPDDQVFLKYARWALTGRWNEADHLRLAGAVLELIPEPHGAPWWKKEGAPAVEEKPKKKRKTTRKKKARDKPPAKKSPARNLIDLLGGD